MSGFVLCVSSKSTKITPHVPCARYQPKIDGNVRMFCALSFLKILLGLFFSLKINKGRHMVWDLFFSENTRRFLSQNDVERPNVWLCSLRLFKILYRRLMFSVLGVSSNDSLTAACLWDFFPIQNYQALFLFKIRLPHVR